MMKKSWICLSYDSSKLTLRNQMKIYFCLLHEINGFR